MGAALFDLIASSATYATYQARGWHAQLRQLGDTARGRDAADRAGLSPSSRTYLRWLAHPGDDSPGGPSKANRAKIERAYKMAQHRPFPDSMRTGTAKITGVVAFDTDERMRGGGSGNAPLRVDFGELDWDEVAEHWDAGDLAEDWLEEWFGDAIADDSGIGYPASFPAGGGSYSVSH
jgi:hypothetical protein